MCGSEAICSEKIVYPMVYLSQIYSNRGTLLLLWNEKSAYMVFFPHNHYQIVYLYFSVFQLVSTNCFSIFGLNFF